MLIGVSLVLQTKIKPNPVRTWQPINHAHIHIYYCQLSKDELLELSAPNHHIGRSFACRRLIFKFRPQQKNVAIVFASRGIFYCALPFIEFVLSPNFWRMPYANGSIGRSVIGVVVRITVQKVQEHFFFCIILHTDRLSCFHVAFLIKVES